MGAVQVGQVEQPGPAIEALANQPLERGLAHPRVVRLAVAPAHPGAEAEPRDAQAGLAQRHERVRVEGSLGGTEAGATGGKAGAANQQASGSQSGPVQELATLKLHEGHNTTSRPRATITAWPPVG